MAPLTAEEVCCWFDKIRGKKPSFAICDQIAIRLTGPPSAEWIAYQAHTRRTQNDDDFVDHLKWDVPLIAKSADTLAKNIPAMRKFWENLFESPKVRNARDDLAELERVLAKCIDHIKFPLGKYEKRRKHEPKDWHYRAVAIARLLDDALRSVRSTPNKIHRNSTLVVITHVALKRLGYVGLQRSAVAAHLNKVSILQEWIKGSRKPAIDL